MIKVFFNLFKPFLKRLPLIYPKYKKYLKIQSKLNREIKEKRSYKFGLEETKNTNFKFKLKKNTLVNKFHKRKKNIFYHDKMVIFGSGPSLLKLKLNEKKILQKLPKLFFNRNIIFWKIINIWPEYYFFVDNYGVAKKIFHETMKEINKTKKKYPILFLEEFYKHSTPKELKPIFFNFFHRNLNWSNSLKNEMFGCYGSLSVLLNLISATKLSKNILILGVDLNTPGTYFDKYRKSKKNLFNKEEKLDFKWGMHQTLYDGKEGINILTNWSVIQKNLKKRGIKLYCGNKNSELVTSGLVKYISTADFKKK